MPYDPVLDQLIAYFDMAVLAQYRAQPDKYRVLTDNFSGEVKLTESYYRKSDDADYIRVRFGYRTLKSGDVVIAAFAPDLVKGSAGHAAKWRPHLLQSAEWRDYDEDDRFSRWVKRYLEGSWRVDNGPGYYLGEEIKFINGLTLEAVGKRLYDVPPEITVVYPLAGNTHDYENAHRDLYGILIDGLETGCIRALGTRFGRPIDKAAVQTMKALKSVLPEVAKNTEFVDPLDNVSEQRRRASHGIRPQAEPMRAFETFEVDLDACLNALRLLRSSLEKELSMDAKHTRNRQEALTWLPVIAQPHEPHYSINGATQMVGKTVEKVEIGSRQETEEVHRSEVIIVHFTDGSIMSIDTGSNAGNFSCEKHRPEDFHVDFIIQWVPPK